jgi:outer membrane lipoprotein LolB
MSMRFSRLAASALMAAALAGCATGAAKLSNPAATVGPYRDTISLTGRLAVTYENDGQPGSMNGKFTWDQRPGHLDVAMLSPLGQTQATIAVTPQAATLTLAGQPPREAKDIDTLTAQTLGWSLPVSGLRDWLQGYATDANGKRFIASPANNSVVTQDGWRLRFATWQAGTATPTPQRIDAARSATATTDALDIHIIVDPQG